MSVESRMPIKIVGLVAGAVAVAVVSSLVTAAAVQAESRSASLAVVLVVVLAATGAAPVIGSMLSASARAAAAQRAAEQHADWMRAFAELTHAATTAIGAAPQPVRARPAPIHREATDRPNPRSIARDDAADPKSSVMAGGDTADQVCPAAPASHASSAASPSSALDPLVDDLAHPFGTEDTVDTLLFDRTKVSPGQTSPARSHVVRAART